MDSGIKFNGRRRICLGIGNWLHSAGFTCICFGLRASVMRRDIALTTGATGSDVGFFNVAVASRTGRESSFESHPYYPRNLVMAPHVRGCLLD